MICAFAAKIVFGNYASRKLRNEFNFTAIQVVNAAHNANSLLVVVEIQDRCFASQSFDCHDDIHFSHIN